MNESGWYAARAVRRGLTAAIAALGLAALSAPMVAQQTGTVSGRVVAAGTNRPLQNAQVAVVGTNIGTQTGADGRYTLLNVPSGRTQIRVSAIGYAVGTVQLTVVAGQTATADVSLSTSVLRLDEVVVTGTAGAARKREIGNSIAQLNVADVADPPQNVDQLLTARARERVVAQRVEVAAHLRAGSRFVHAHDRVEDALVLGHRLRDEARMERRFAPVRFQPLAELEGLLSLPPAGLAALLRGITP